MSIARRTIRAATVNRICGATIGLLWLLLLTNNALPYAGLKDDSCQTMFSQLDYGDGVSKSNNHLFMPQMWLSDLWDSWFHIEASLVPDADKTSFEGQLVEWLNTPERQHNREAVRVVVRQLCDRGYAVHLNTRDRLDNTWSGNACDEPVFSEPVTWLPVRLYEPSAPWGGW